MSRAGYYAQRARGESARTEQDRNLSERIRAIFVASRGTYGSPRILERLRREGVNVSRKRVARLMRSMGFKARSAKLYHANPGSHAFFAAVPNRQLDRRASAPDQVWVGDITYLKVGRRWRYLAAVMDRYSRRIVGWKLGPNKDAKLTLAALNQAVERRRPSAGLLFHTDRGIEYAAYAFRDRLAELGFVQSMNRPGRLVDNAFMESFFHSMKSDLIHGIAVKRDDQLRQLLKLYIPYYNRTRMHSGLGYRSPIDYERTSA